MLAQATKTRAKGFTLVELIVVITILAILATVGFLSLQGYTGDAKNTKTTANLRSVASSLSNEAAISQQAVSYYVSGAVGTLSGVYTANTGSVYGKTVNLAGATAEHKAGEVDYAKLRIDGAKFFDSTSGSVMKPFLLGTVSVSETVGSSTRARTAFQLAATISNGGTQVAEIQGNYSQSGTTDMAGLIRGQVGCKTVTATTNSELTLTSTAAAGAVVVVDNGACLPYQL